MNLLLLFLHENEFVIDDLQCLALVVLLAFRLLFIPYYSISITTTNNIVCIITTDHHKERPHPHSTIRRVSEYIVVLAQANLERASPEDEIGKREIEKLDCTRS